jgi:hypothetical protein
MKHIFLGLMIVLAGFNTHAQNTKSLVYDANVEARTVGSFSSVQVSGTIDLYLLQGTDEGVAISAANDEAKNLIKTEVTNGVLHIYSDNKGGSWKSWGNTKSKAYVSFKDLKHVEAHGACNIIIVETIKLANLKIDCSGACDFKGTVAIANLNITASGASNIRISGNAGSATVEASGVSSIRCYELKAETCRAEASGAANIRITVTKDFKAEASGGATIYYKGEANISNVSTSGGASIKKASQ